VRTRGEYSFPFASKLARRLVPPTLPGDFFRRLRTKVRFGWSSRRRTLVPIDRSAGCAAPFGCRTYGAREPALFFPSELIRVAGGARCRFGVRRSAAYHQRRPNKARRLRGMAGPKPALFSHLERVRNTSTAGTSEQTRPRYRAPHKMSDQRYSITSPAGKEGMRELLETDYDHVLAGALEPGERRYFLRLALRPPPTA
jgi:hypothetical protein